MSPNPSASPRPANEIDTNDRFTFEPSILHLKPGTEVTWMETTKFTPHDVRLDGDPSNMVHDLASLGQTYKFTFNTKGTFHFVCTLHTESHMEGDIVVE